jgi:transcriptional regulator with XRE-family HTH domain
VGDWAAVARVVNERMHERGITQRELSDRSGVSVATLRKIQRGVDQDRNRTTLANVSRALGFPDEHLWRVSVEGKPFDTTTNTEKPTIATIQDELVEIRQRVEAIERRLEQ